MCFIIAQMVAGGLIVSCRHALRERWSCGHRDSLSALGGMMPRPGPIVKAGLLLGGELLLAVYGACGVRHESLGALLGCRARYGDGVAPGR